MNNKKATIIFLACLLLALVGLPKISFKHTLSASKDYRNKISNDSDKLPNEVLESNEGGWLISQPLGENLIVLNTRTLNPIAKEAKEWERIKSGSPSLDLNSFALPNIDLLFKIIILKKKSQKNTYALANDGDVYKFTLARDIHTNIFPDDYNYKVVASLGSQGVDAFATNNLAVFNLKITPDILKISRENDTWKVQLNAQANFINYQDFVVLGVRKVGSNFRSGQAVLLVSNPNSSAEEEPNLKIPEDIVIDLDDDLPIDQIPTINPSSDQISALPVASQPLEVRPIATNSPGKILVIASQFPTPSSTPIVKTTTTPEPTGTPTTTDSPVIIAEPTSTFTAAVRKTRCCCYRSSESYCGGGSSGKTFNSLSCNEYLDAPDCGGSPSIEHSNSGSMTKKECENAGAVDCTMTCGTPHKKWCDDSYGVRE